MLAKNFNLQWPSNVNALLSDISFVSSSQQSFLSFDCFYQQMAITSINSYYLRVIVFGITPVLLSIGSSIVWIFVKCICKSKKIALRRNIVITWYTIILLLYPTITTTTFSLFACMNYEDGNSYMINDMNIECWGPEHVKFSLLIGMPLIFVWTIGFPVIIFWAMFKRR